VTLSPSGSPPVQLKLGGQIVLLVNPFGGLGLLGSYGGLLDLHTKDILLMFPVDETTLVPISRKVIPIAKPIFIDSLFVKTPPTMENVLKTEGTIG